MKVSIAALLLSTASLVYGEAEESIVLNRDSRIVGGDVVKNKIYPWMASIQNKKDQHNCGGSLIADEWVLTAAHCIGSYIHHVEFDQYDQEGKTEKGSIEVTVKKMIKHPQYNSNTMDHDIALLQLSKKLTDRATVSIRQQELGGGVKVQVIGWGATGENGGASGDLMHVEVSSQTVQQCQKLYKPTGYKITDNMLCAFAKNKDSCYGDSGGPLFLGDTTDSHELVGVVSWGQECAHKKYPGVYARAGNYIDWIEKYVGKLPDNGDGGDEPEEPEDSVCDGLSEGKCRKQKKKCEWARKDRECRAKTVPTKSPTPYPTAKPTKSPTPAPTEENEYEYEYEEYEPMECEDFITKQTCLDFKHRCKWLGIKRGCVER